MDLESDDENNKNLEKRTTEKKKEYMKNMEDNIEHLYEEKMRDQKVHEKSTEIVDMIPRSKKISKKEGILKKNIEKRDFEKEHIDFNEVKEKINWFD